MALQHHEREHRLALDLVRATHDSGLRHPWVRDQRRLDFHCAEAMPGYIQHIIDAPHDPVIAVRVAVRRIAGEVIPILEPAPVSLQVALVIAPDGAQHRGPRPLDDEIAALADLCHCPPAIIDNVNEDARERLCAGAGLGRCNARNRRDHDRAGLRLPPGIHDRATLGADHAVIPHPGFRIDRFTNAPKEA